MSWSGICGRPTSGVLGLGRCESRGDCRKPGRRETNPQGRARTVPARCRAAPAGRPRNPVRARSQAGARGTPCGAAAPRGESGRVRAPRTAGAQGRARAARSRPVPAGGGASPRGGRPPRPRGPRLSRSRRPTSRRHGPGPGPRYGRVGPRTRRRRPRWESRCGGQPPVVSARRVFPDNRRLRSTEARTALRRSRRFRPGRRWPARRRPRAG